MRIYPVLFLIFSGLGVGVIAIIQNQNFYSTYSAFYDSMGYFNQLAWVMQSTQDKGFWVAITDSYSHSTVFLPWLFGALLSYVTEPSRILGVAIQMPLIILQLFTGYRFFRSTGASQGRAMVYSLPMITYPALFNFNGGLGDFRMDLSQALAYGSFLAALMVARKRDSLKEWVFVGFIISVACLFRATTPVYVFIVLGTAFFLDLRKLGLTLSLQRYLLIGIVVILLTGWFYLLNYDHLHYYYFVWNTDANARLPLQDSIMHINFVAKHLGLPLLTALFVLMLAAVMRLIKCCRWRSFSFNWVALIGALVPASYLVLSGAGLNPFVSMVAVPGFILFALNVGECTNSTEQTLSNRNLSIILTIALAVSISNSIKDSKKDISNWIPYKNGVAQLLDSIHNDAQSRRLNHIELTFLYLGSVDGAVIKNHLIYEEGYKYLQNRDVNKDKMTVGTLQHGFGAEAEWIKIPGATDQAKLDYVVKDTLEKANYIIMADEDSDLPTHHRVNHYARQMRTILENNNEVEKLESGITLSKTEKVTVYRIKKNGYIK
ncbi:MAG TPA: hypothetical protein VES38_12465 [Methylotenera sp.]|nr:hypothetical protein [Methylotenera sp.]